MQGVVTPIRAVLRPATGVKIGSRGQRPLLPTVNGSRSKSGSRSRVCNQLIYKM